MNREDYRIKKFHRKPVEVEALKVLNDPESLANALELTGDDAVPNYRSVFDLKGIRVPVRGGAKFANLGDYIVKDEEGNLDVLSPEQFSREFEPEN